MPYTTQGYMTAADLYDHQLLHDLHIHPDCPGHEDEDGIAFCRAVEDCPGEAPDMVCPFCGDPQGQRIHPCGLRKAQP